MLLSDWDKTVHLPPKQCSCRESNAPADKPCSCRQNCVPTARTMLLSDWDKAVLLPANRPNHNAPVGMLLSMNLCCRRHSIAAVDKTMFLPPRQCFCRAGTKQCYCHQNAKTTILLWVCSCRRNYGRQTNAPVRLGSWRLGADFPNLADFAQ